jgi:cytochrome c5
MRTWRYFFLGVSVLALLPALSQWGSKAMVLAQNVQLASKKNAIHNSRPSAGERKFEQNCSRCHNAPEDISPRIAGTVLRHMRVRASLNKQDAEDILHFLNP